MRLSIVVSAYNVEKNIVQTLNSIVGQTSNQFELIVVDDGSTDRTYDQIKDILEAKCKCDYKIICQNNGGVSSARNKGLMETSGDFVMFLDGDDYVALDLVECIDFALKSQTADVICWGYNTVKEDQAVIISYFDTFKHIKKPITGIKAFKKILIHKNMWICTGSAAYRRELLNKYQIHYTEGCANGEDQEFTYKALSRAKKIVFINKVLLFYVQREGSLSNSKNIKKFDAINALKRSCCYLCKSRNKNLCKMADIINNQLLVESYFDNLDTCIGGPDIQLLIKKIITEYPNLDIDIREAMKRYRRGRLKIIVKSQVYLISPYLYAKLILLKRKINKA